MIYTVTLNAALDKTMQISGFTIGSLNRVESVRVEAGGKGINVAKAIRSLGHTCVAMGFLAGSTGELIEHRLHSVGIECDFVHVNGETRTNSKIMDPDTRTVTEINESGEAIVKGQLELLEKNIMERVCPGDTVILSGSVPPGTDTGIYAKWIGMLRARGAATMLDADGELFLRGVEAVPTAVKPNLSELSRFCDKRLKEDCDIRPEAKKLVKRGIETVLVSMGADGTLLFCEQGEWRADALPIEVTSTVGAGDAMVAAWAVARERSLPPEDMLRLAVSAAGATVMIGTAGLFSKRTVDDLMPDVRIDPFTE